jgi:diaminohydroxyphosphoribosylaminopyrimidine deaminase/5-amino-6-(5-phosphoribosylamino)uracil reductase
VQVLLAPKENTSGFFVCDDDYMKLVLRLASRGLGRVSPNPMVGAVVVRDKSVLSEGYHVQFGSPHAEAAALAKLSPSNCAGSTLYVNLEPCNHYGKTAPCTDRIIESGIRRVVIGTEDPNPLVRGKGIQALRTAGIDVKTGVLEVECRKVNEAFFKAHTQRQPFVTLKIGQTLDGKIATSRDTSRWITSEFSRRVVHRMRTQCDAILVGIKTVMTDDPELTIRYSIKKSPSKKRIILDSRLQIPVQARVLHLHDPQNTIVVATPEASPKKIKILKDTGATIWEVNADDTGRVDLHRLAHRLVDHGIHSLIVEGGQEVFTAFFRTGLVDRLVVFIAPTIFGSGRSSFGELGIESPDNALRFRDISWKRVGEDMMFDGRF